jgi:hypothetical protein
VPLPLGTIHNQRSLVALDNLVDLIVTCLTHPAAANQTFLVSDGEDVSTTELLRRMGQAMGHRARLIPVPASWLKLAAALVGKPDVAQRMCVGLCRWIFLKLGNCWGGCLRCRWMRGCDGLLRGMDCRASLAMTDGWNEAGV